MTRIDRVYPINYDRLNVDRQYKDKYVKCYCGKYYIRRNKTAHGRTQFHKDYQEHAGFNIMIPKHKIQYKKKDVYYDINYISIWGSYKE